MPTVTYTKDGPKIGNFQFLSEFSTRNWSSSPRINGKLALKGNPYSKLFGKYASFKVTQANAGSFPLNPRVDVQTFPGQIQWLKILDSECYGKFRGKIYKGSASLGVTLASYRQSREMIVGRYNQLTGKATKGLSLLQREYEAYLRRSNYGRYSKGRTRWERVVANFHLEVIFGWVPLVKDIHAAATTVIQLAASRHFVTAKVKAFDSWSSLGISVSTVRDQVYRVVRSAVVLVENPNRWLQERAGLLNPLTVAWDLVPWSFVVNMFTNINQLVQSITDFAGLNLINTTKSVTTHERQFKAVRGDFAESFSVDQRRIIDVSLPLRLNFKIPDASWENAAMAASLFTQKLSLINRLLRK